MPSAFRPASLLIETDLDRSGLKPEEVLLDPKAHAPADSRVLLHETLHYWQQLSQGFLFRLAVEDLARLEGFEADGSIAPPGPHRREYFRRYEPVGFSALDLQEALARCWDVHVLGPPLLLRLERDDPRLSWSADHDARYAALEKAGLLTAPDGSGYSGNAYDLAMAAAAGRYARPYLLLLDRMPSKSAASMFPLIAHLAFDTDRPVACFLRLLECAAPLFEPPAAAGGDIEDIWTSSFGAVAELAGEIALSLDGGLDAMPLLVAGEAAGLPPGTPLHWAQQQLRAAVDALAQRREVCERAARLGVHARSIGAAQLRIRLATPGIPLHRGFLATWLSPPVIRFADGERWMLGEVHRRMGVPSGFEAEPRLSAEAAAAADACAALDARWRQFVRAGLRKGAGAGPAGADGYESAVYDGARAIASLDRQTHPLLAAWLIELLRPPRPGEGTPLETARGWRRFVRAVLAAGPARPEDVDFVCEILLMKLGGHVPAAVYESRTGISWDWGGSPLETVLAAEFCAVAAEVRLGDEGRAKRCRAIELEALKSDGIAAAVALAPGAEELGEALRDRIVLLDLLTDEGDRAEAERAAAAGGDAPIVVQG